MGPKRMRLAQHMKGFQQAGFARAVMTADQVDMGIEIERGTTQVSKISQAQLTD